MNPLLPPAQPLYLPGMVLGKCETSTILADIAVI